MLASRTLAVMLPGVTVPSSSVTWPCPRCSLRGRWSQKQTSESSGGKNAEQNKGGRAGGERALLDGVLREGLPAETMLEKRSS